MNYAISPRDLCDTADECMHEHNIRKNSVILRHFNLFGSAVHLIIRIGGGDAAVEYR